MTVAKRRHPGPDTAPYRNGNLMDYVDRSAVREQATATDHYAIPDEWRDNQPFHATLTLTGVERGRSAARFMWYSLGDNPGHTYPMFMTDACDLLMSDEGIVMNTATGWWIVVKRGRNYGIARLRRDLAQELS